ncbi:MAG: hypothetical protein ACRDO2_10525 [Nocardioidaceae bacterium]
MANLDNFTREVSGRIVPPDFDDLVRVSRRRRRTSVIGAAAAVVLLAGLTGYGARGLAHDDATPTQPATTMPATTPNESRPSTPGDTVPTAPQPMTAEEIVRDPGSYLVAFAASSTDPEVRASVWRCQEQPRCAGWRGGITVTQDSYRTSHVLDLPRNANLSVTDLGSAGFLVGDAPRGVVVHGDGSAVDLVADDVVGPLAEGEVLVPYWRGLGTQSSGGLDPRTGRVHPLSLPAGTNLSLQQSGDLLYGAMDTETQEELVLWSDDGARTWHEASTLPSFPNAIYAQTPSMASGVMAWVAGGDGARLFPFDKVLRSTDNGETFETIEQDPDAMAYVSFSLVLPDGRLLVSIDAWSDDSPGEPGQQPHGLYVSDGDDWADLAHVEPTYPEGTDEALLASSPPFVMDWTAGPDGEVTLWAWASGINTPMLVSADTGRTWSESAAR